MDPTAGRTVAQVLLLWLPVAAWAALIFLLSSESEPPDPAGLAGHPGWTLAAHFGLYLVLGALLSRAFDGSGPQKTARGGLQRSGGQGAKTESGGREQGAGDGRTMATNPYLLAFVAGALYAATDEIHQYFVPMRQADSVDWLVDIAGVLVGALSVLASGRHSGKL